jgi:hypothetical protein
MTKTANEAMTHLRDGALAMDVAHEIAVTLTKDEFVIVTRELTKVHAFDPLHGAAKSAFVKLIRAARNRADAIAVMASEPDNGDRFY